MSMLSLKRFTVLALVLAALSTLATAHAADEASAMELRLKKLESELRCLVCQNQTLADSNASLAADLRREVREQAAAGKSDQEIRDFLRARYGDFVLYDPPMEPTTYLLWFGPFVLLAGGALFAVLVVRRRAAPPAAAPAAVVRVEALLSEEPADGAR